MADELVDPAIGISLRMIREFDAKTDTDMSGFTVTVPPEWIVIERRVDPDGNPYYVRLLRGSREPERMRSNG